MQGANVGRWLEYGAQAAGINGKMQFGLDALHDVRTGGTPVDSWLGPDIGLVEKTFGAPHIVAQGGEGLLGQADHMMQAAQYISRDKSKEKRGLSTAKGK